MKILVLYGPNLDLIGWISRNAGSRLTLDRINRELRRVARELEIELKIAQTPSESDASKLIRNQRNKVSGILLVPGLWAETGRLLKETIEIIGLPLAVFYLEPESGPWHHEGKTLFTGLAALESPGTDGVALGAILLQFVQHLRP